MKEVLKSGIRIFSTVCVLPVLLVYALFVVAGGRDSSFSGFSQLLCCLPGKTGTYLRCAFLRWTAAHCDQDVCIGFGTIFSDRNVSLGRSAYIGNYCSIGNAIIQGDVLIASHVSIMNGMNQHQINRLDVPVREQSGEFPQITIGEDSWIGEKAIVSANIGKHCVVGAGAVVLNDVPDYAIVVGVPAKVIGDRRDLAEKRDLAVCRDTPEA